MAELMRLPRSPSLPSAATSPFWRDARDSNPSRSSLTTKRPPQQPRVPSEWSQRRMLGWSARGDSNPDLHGLNVPRLPIAPRADDMVSGPSGWTRTTTARVKSPACSVDTTEGLLWFGLRVSNPCLRAGNAACSFTPRPNAGRWGSPAHSSFPSVVKEPALASWWTPTAPFRLTSRHRLETQPPRDPARLLLASGPKTKRPSRGSP